MFAFILSRFKYIHTVAMAQYYIMCDMPHETLPYFDTLLLMGVALSQLFHKFKV